MSAASRERQRLRDAREGRSRPDPNDPEKYLKCCQCGVIHTEAEWDKATHEHELEMLQKEAAEPGGIPT